jgi:hypothetical protein
MVDMNPDLFRSIAEVLVVTIPVLGLSIVGLVVLGRSRLGEALARRIAGERYDPETEAQLAALREEVAALHHQLQETQERVEFAERLLSNPTPVPTSRPAEPRRAADHSR